VGEGAVGVEEEDTVMSEGAGAYNGGASPCA